MGMGLVSSDMPSGMEWRVLEVVHRQLSSAGSIARTILNFMPGEKLNSQASLAWDLSNSGLDKNC